MDERARVDLQGDSLFRISARFGKADTKRTRSLPHIMRLFSLPIGSVVPDIRARDVLAEHGEAAGRENREPDGVVEGHAIGRGHCRVASRAHGPLDWQLHPVLQPSDLLPDLALSMDDESYFWSGAVRESSHERPVGELLRQLVSVRSGRLGRRQCVLCLPHTIGEIVKGAAHGVGQRYRMR